MATRVDNRIMRLLSAGSGAVTALVDDLRVPSGKRLSAHLGRAERELRWLRAFGMLVWLVVLFRQGSELGPAVVAMVCGFGVAYVAWIHWEAESGRSLERIGIVTMVGDPLLVAMLCFVTGGIESVLYPFFYFTLLAAAFRSGMAAGFAALLVNALLTILLYFTAPGSTPELATLGMSLLYNVFAATLGAMLVGWARENFDMVLAQSRSLRDAGQRSQALVRRLMDVQEEESSRIAGELHDRMSGHLFSLRQGVERCRARCSEQPECGAQSGIRDALGGLAEEVGACSTAVRSIMDQLQPTVLEELGFYEAAAEYLAAQAEIVPFRMQVSFSPSLRHWRSQHDALLFRILQEALLNVRKHAKAENVQVSLRLRDGDVLLTIADDGIGFESDESKAGHYGVMIMRERAAALGAELHLQSGALHGGTRVEIRLPGPGAARP